ncbi:MAG: tetratricopeptide repeat protein [Fuerstiella sp.]
MFAAPSRRFSLLFLLMAAAAVSGCSRPAPPADSKGPEATAVNAETEGEKCRKKLAAAIRRLDPQSLSLQENPERSINGLNAWIASCAADDMAELTVSEATLKMLDDNPRVTAGRFTVADANYIRDCLLLRDLTTSVWIRTSSDGQGIGNEAARVISLFHWLVRNVSLMRPDEQRVPVGLFDVLLTGRGTAEDRAWIFVEALRQQHIHTTFVVQPNGDPEAEGDLLATAPWLVVVVLEDGSMLFDPATGVAVPSADAASTAPAGITALRQHSRWKDSQIRLVTQVSAFAPRMLILQNQLAAEDSAVFYEELTGGVSEITPLIDLAVKAGDGLWTKDDVDVWTYPEERSVSALAYSEEQQQAHALLMRPFDAPFERKVFSSKSMEELTTVPEELSPEERRRLTQQRLMDNFIKMNQSSEEMFGKPSRGLLKARIQQILGDTDSGVIPQLQQIRIASMQESIQVAVPEEIQKEIGMPPLLTIPFPQLIREVNESSTGDSLYWTAMCQVDQGDVGAAITTLMNYRRLYPDGKWKYPSLMNQATALQTQGRAADAKAVLEQADEAANPEQSRVRFLLAELAEEQPEA